MNEIIMHEGVQYRKVERDVRVGDRVVVTNGLFWSEGMEGRVFETVDGRDYGLDKYPDDEDGAIYVPMDSSPGRGMPFLRGGNYAVLEPLADAKPAATPKLTDAKPGDRVRIVNANDVEDIGYSNGEEYVVSRVWGDCAGVDVEYAGSDIALFAEEFDVVRDYSAAIMKACDDQIALHEANKQVDDITSSLRQGIIGHSRVNGPITLAELVDEVTQHDPATDNVEKPAHYNAGNVEVIEIIEQLTAGYDGYTAYCLGNVLKYIARAPYKHEEPTEDLRKAQRYMEYALAAIDEAET